MHKEKQNERTDETKRTKDHMKTSQTTKHKEIKQ